jgi:glutaminyl-peptide cyclotransferase
MLERQLSGAYQALTERRHVRIQYLVLVLLLMLFPAALVAQDDATPPVIACNVDSRSTTDIIDVLFDQEGRPVEVPEPTLQVQHAQGLPSGAAVDGATIAEIDAVAQELAACLNTGNPLKSFTLYTDDLLLRQGLQTDSTRQDVLDMLEVGLALPAPQATLQIRPAHSASVLPDGRIAADFFAERAGVADALTLVFLRQDGTWRLDDMSPVFSVIPRAPVSGYVVVSEYPHDPAAFTQGLLIHDGQLYEGTGRYGESTLRKMDLETGRVMQSLDLYEEYFGEGIAILGDRIYQLTWLNGKCFVYDLETFTLLETFTYSTQGWGLTTDGDRLIMGDGTNRIVFRDPDTFDDVGHIDVRDGDVPVSNLNELEYIDGEIWANVYQTGLIVRIDPPTGHVTGWINMAGLLSEEDRASGDIDVLNGIAHDPQTGRIFVTGKLWPKLFEIEPFPPR